MEVKLLRTTIVSGGTSPASVPLNIFHFFAFDMHMATLLAFSPPAPSSAHLSAALSDTLILFPTLAGRFGDDPLGRPAILSGHGALLVEAEVDADLRDHVPLRPSPALLRLHPPEGPPLPGHLLQVQLNWFRCGGVVVGFTMHHRAADSCSAGMFVEAWGRAVARRLHGETAELAGGYGLYDQSWLRPREPPRCEYQHWGVEFKAGGGRKVGDLRVCESLENVRLHFSREFIERELKGRSLGEKQHYTTFQGYMPGVLLGHLWRKITIARRLLPEQSTSIRFGVNGRQRLCPPVLPDFFGNLVLNAHARAKVHDLLDIGVAGTARLVKEVVACTASDSYFRSFIDFCVLHAGQDLVPITEGEDLVLSPDLEVNSWLGLRFTVVNFGSEAGGRLWDFSPSWIPFEGIIVLAPGVEGKGINAWVTLLEPDAGLLKEISHVVE